MASTSRVSHGYDTDRLDQEMNGCRSPRRRRSAPNVFCGYIAWAKDASVAHGYPDGLYRPGNAVTRGAMAAFLYRIAAGEPISACRSRPFTDVPTGLTFCGVIAWAKSHGITYGVGHGRYGAAEPVTRQAMASFLRRIAPFV